MWYISDYFGRIMHETPFITSAYFLCRIIIAVIYGIEVAAAFLRNSAAFCIGGFYFIMILLLKNINFKYITPVMENGLLPALKGSIYLSCYITFTVVNILIIYPRYIEKKTQAQKAIIKGFIWSGAVAFVSILMTLLILGSAVTSRSSFPPLLLATEINVGTVITRVEYVLSIIWLFTQFMICLAFFYSGLTGLSELVGLRDHKKIVWPLGLTVLILSGIVFPNTLYQGNWINTVFMPLIITMGLIIPMGLMIVHAIRTKIKHLS
jgi:spore germination protein KB